MLKFSKRSLDKLATVDRRLQSVFHEALSTGLIDFSIIEGVRDKETQDKYFYAGKSKVKWPNGKHNVRSYTEKARAIDAAPFVNGNISWKKEHCIFLAGVVLACAKTLNIKVRWGGNWDSDLEPVTDQNFQDLVHFELL
jgi:peptidoglycan L-alanyl-D-glutamate endopeptidase CwlK